MGSLLEITLNAVVALVFATAAVGKLRDAQTFEGVVANFQVLPEPLAAPFARLLPWLELAVALAIWAPGPVGDLAQAAGAGLLAVFALAIAINVRRGRTEIDCGCFQTAGRQPLGWALVARNLLLAAALAAGATFRGAATTDPLVWANALAGGVALFLIYLAAGELLALRSRLNAQGARA